MVSPTALICKRYAAGCTKTRTKILQVKRGQKERNAPDSARKRRNRVRFGCWRGWERLRTGANGWENLGIGQTDLSRLSARSARSLRATGTHSPHDTHCAGAQPCLVAKTFRPVTKNSATAKAVALFLAGAEGLEPSARGFGVDVETQQREQERGSVDGFSRRSHKRVVLVWCCEGFSRSECSQKTG